MAISIFRNDNGEITTQASEIAAAGTAIKTFVEQIYSTTMTEVNACYSGAAASAYDTALKNLSEAVSTAVDGINTALQTAITAEEAAYAAKQAQMVDSVAVPGLDQ